MQTIQCQKPKKTQIHFYHPVINQKPPQTKSEIIRANRSTYRSPARALPVPTSTPRKTERRGREGELETALEAISRETERGAELLLGSCCPSNGFVSDQPLLLPPAAVDISFPFRLLSVVIGPFTLSLSIPSLRPKSSTTDDLHKPNNKSFYLFIYLLHE